MHKKTLIDFKDLGKRLIFTNPIETLVAEDLDQVLPVLSAVETWQKQGYYVVGYLSYEASAAFDPKLVTHLERLNGEYLAYFTVHDQYETEPFPLTYEPVTMPDQWEEDTSQAAYQAAIQEIHQQIRQGNTYQVNHTIRLKSQCQAQGEAIYQRLVVEQGASYNALVQHDQVSIISASPELFFEKRGETLITRPMKGTTSRGLTLAEDRRQAAWLAADPKNRSENMMIVDLLRNDMGKICQIGSVQVTKLCTVEPYSTVWQMTSTIEGQLQADQGLLAIFQALYPCGSITGAPKMATMAIIKQLETSPRGVYCGAVGICLPNGDAIFNVAIRTVQLQADQAYYGVGGGITWDSHWQDEYEETRQKSQVLYRKRPLFDLVTTGRVEGGQLTFKAQHLQRLEEAASYFAYPCDLAQLDQDLAAQLASLSADQTYRLRIALTKAGAWQLDCQPYEDLSEDYCQALLVTNDLPPTAFTYFKTSHRPHIQPADREQILISAAGLLQETSIGNLILEIEGQLYTPSLSSGCLPGIYRQHLLDQGRLVESSLTLSDLERADKIYACNALRGIYQLWLAKED